MAWQIERDTEGGRVVYRITADDGNTVIGTLDGFTGCVEGALRRLSPAENEANAERVAKALGVEVS